MYLKTSYEIVLQYMNLHTWTTCIKIAIKELSVVRITEIKNEKTVRLLHCHFRECKQFSIPNSYTDTTAALFSLFPDAKKKIVLFCNKQITEGFLSVEVLRTEIKNEIIPSCYSNLISECHESTRDSIPSLKRIIGIDTYIDNIIFDRV